jgi:hypothetical protein
VRGGSWEYFLLFFEKIFGGMGRMITFALPNEMRRWLAGDFGKFFRL